jgi:hypothetical protein
LQWNPQDTARAGIPSKVDELEEARLTMYLSTERRRKQMIALVKQRPAKPPHGTLTSTQNMEEKGKTI